jgi:hypothetical protein
MDGKRQMNREREKRNLEEHRKLSQAERARHVSSEM